MTGHLVHCSADATEALTATEAFLAEDPVRHNVVLDVMQERVHHREAGRYWWVTRAGRVVGVALQSPSDRPASITPMDDDALTSLVATMATDAPGLPGVIGEARTAAGFAGRWSEHLGGGAGPVEGERLYRLGQLRIPTGVAGHSRNARPDELDLLMSCWKGLAADTGLAPPAAGGRELIARRIDQGEMWIWEDRGVAVSVARLSAPAAQTVRVGFVYTPPEQRRNGYAGASVAAISAHALNAGASHCVLYTQLDNPTSNGIYRHLGYEAVAEILSYRLSLGSGW
jgi:GNAT superfamily N-acetyltransferase